MTKRFLDDDFWGDSFVQTLSCEAKLFYIYLFSNKHVKASGMYELTARTAAFETGLAEKDIAELFEALKDKVVWRPQTGIVWVKNFVVYQCTNPTWLQAAVEQACTFAVKDKPLVVAYVNHLRLKLDGKPWMRLEEALGEGVTNLVRGCSPVLSCNSNNNSPVLSDGRDTQEREDKKLSTPPSYSSDRELSKKQQQLLRSNPQEYRKRYGHLLDKGVKT
jgi:hypothetical protein